MQKYNIAFFGTPDIAVHALNELEKAGITPSLIVTNPDRPSGRSQTLTPPPVKEWAKERDIRVIQPVKLEKENLGELLGRSWDVFVVVAYGALMPKWLIELPTHGTLNLHPSLLPSFRGASPIRTSILEGLKGVGVTVMLMDEKMDHGPILAQLPVSIPFPVPGKELDESLAKTGGALLAGTIPEWINGNITPKEQNHSEATYSKKITKEMGELQLDPYNLPKGKEAYEMYLKICAFDGWPLTYFFHNGKRIKITDASLIGGKEGSLEIHKVIPEGKKEIDFSVFLQTIEK